MSNERNSNCALDHMCFPLYFRTCERDASSVHVRHIHSRSSDCVQTQIWKERERECSIFSFPTLLPLSYLMYPKRERERERATIFMGTLRGREGKRVPSPILPLSSHGTAFRGAVCLARKRRRLRRLRRRRRRRERWIEL